jgi:hypothetical protein
VALVPEGFVHHKFVSDLAGVDIPSHDQTPANVIRAISGWLTLQPDYSPPAPSPRTILEAYPQLEELLKKSKNDALGHLTWPVIAGNVDRVITSLAEAEL